MDKIKEAYLNLIQEETYAEYKARKDAERAARDAAMDAELAEMEKELGPEGIRKKLFIDWGTCNGHSREEAHLCDLASRLHSKEGGEHRVKELPQRYNCFHSFECQAPGCSFGYSYDSGD